ncbi:MAG: hypothetical protein Q7S71_04800 [Candidatus Nitrotoga sp.]|nr:hypothetical protein [Candidatus Nitrotoga sp.]
MLKLNVMLTPLIGFDTILDSDGNGKVFVDGTQLTGGAQYGDVHVSISSFEFALLTGSGQVGTTRRRTCAVTVNRKAVNDAEGRVAA